LSPNTDIRGLENLQQLFHRTFASIRDITIDYIEEILAEEESSSWPDNSDISDESNEDESDIAEAPAISEETNDTDDRLILNLIIMIYTLHYIS
jgi:hypothetical protein